MSGEERRTGAATRIAVPLWCLMALSFFEARSVAFAQGVDCNGDYAPGRVLVRFKATTTGGVALLGTVVPWCATAL